MVSRAEKLLEGFTLGVLGASTRKFAPDPKPVKPFKKYIKVIDKGVIESQKTDGSEVKLPWIFWEESDGWKYVLQVLPAYVEFGVTQTWDMMFSCNKDLKIRSKTGFGFDMIGQTFWTGYTMTNQDVSNVISEFNNYLESVKEHKGVDLKTIRTFVTPIDWARKKFEVWFEEKTNFEMRLKERSELERQIKRNK